MWRDVGWNYLIYGRGREGNLDVMEEKEKESAFESHYMQGGQPQADDAYVDLRTTAVNKSNEMVREAIR